MRVALIHNQPADVIAVLEERYPRAGIPDGDIVPEPLLSLALGNLSNLQYLLGKRYPIDALNGFGKTALFYAIGSGITRQSRFFCGRVPMSAGHTSPRGSFDQPIMTARSRTKHTRRSSLMHAAQNSDVQMLKILLQAGASLDARDDLGYNAYDYAVMGSRPENARYLATLGLEAAAPKFSAESSPTVRDHPFLAQLEVDGSVVKLAVAPEREDLLVALVSSWVDVRTPSSGIYLISIANPEQPQIVGKVPGLFAHDFALSPDGKRIYYIELSNTGSPADRKYGLGCGFLQSCQADLAQSGRRGFHEDAFGARRQDLVSAREEH